MIARAWHGAVPLEKADEYYDYVLRTGVADCQSTSGNLGVQVLRRIEGDQAHFLFISFWRSLNDIRAFAGDQIELARYYPEDHEYLLELEPLVTHYDVLTSRDTGTA